MSTEYRSGDLVTYDGTMTPRAMQRCRVAVTYRCGDLALRFPDDATIRVPRTHVTRIITPQYQPDF